MFDSRPVSLIDLGADVLDPGEAEGSPGKIPHLDLVSGEVSASDDYYVRFEFSSRRGRCHERDDQKSGRRLLIMEAGLRNPSRFAGNHHDILSSLGFCLTSGGGNPSKIFIGLDAMSIVHYRLRAAGSSHIHIAGSDASSGSLRSGTM